MKRPLTIAATATLAMLILYACASTIRTGTTSFVTVTIGGPANTAVLKAEAATPWARFRYFLADVKLMPEAYAYIPSIVQAIIVTVTAPDITTPIVGVSNVSSNQTTATIKIEVPNGLARRFTIEGIHGVTSQVTYRASTEADLDGTDITLPISMQFNFAGSAIFVDPVAGNNLNSGLTPSLPLQTITRALTLQSTSALYTAIPVIYAEQGDYVAAGAGPGETFPLQLNPNTALICGGTGFTTVIGSGALATTTIIRGNSGASIDNCKIVVSQESAVAVTDVTGGPPAVPTNMKINGSWIQVSQGGTSIGLTGIILSGDSTVLESRISGTTLSAPNITGVLINGGRPSILDSTIHNMSGALAFNGIGINITASAGDALISGSTISGNVTGITVASSGRPVVASNRILNNSTGLSLTGSTSAQVRGNSIDHNGTGILVSVISVSADPRIDTNSIFCNTFTGADVSALTAIHLENNAWNRDANTLPPGPRVDIGNCLAGADICPRSAPNPIYVPFSTAVSGGCPTP